MILQPTQAAANDLIGMVIANMQFTARLERALSPMTCEAFSALLPFHATLLQARWSGEAAWIPLENFDLGVGQESATACPDVGEILFHPADHSECEILIPYGKTVFRCRDGTLLGNRFLTIIEGRQQLPQMGELVLRQGGQPITFSRVSSYRAGKTGKSDEPRDS